MGMAEPTTESVREALRTVLDPEAGMNIVDLGLVYDIRVSAGSLEVDMTMTTPSCPMGAAIVEDARRAIRALAPAGTAVNVRLVWDPPWDASMMSERARAHFGWR